MKMKIYYCLALALLTLFQQDIQAQNLVEILTESKKLIYSDPSKSNELAEQSFEIAKKQGDVYRMAIAKMISGEVAYKSGDKFKGYYVWRQALNYLDVSDTVDYFNTYQVNKNLSVFFSEVGKYDKAISSLEEAKRQLELHIDNFPEVARKYNDHLILDDIVYNTAKYYIKLKKPLEAETLLQDLIVDYHRSNNPRIYARAKNQLGLSFFHLGNYKKADEYFSDILKIDRLTESQKADYLHNLANTKAKLGNVAEAMELMTEAIELNQKQGGKRKRSLYADYLDRGEFLFASGRYEESMTSLDMAIALNYDVDSDIELFKVYRIKEKVHYALNDHASALAMGSKYDQLNDLIHKHIADVELNELGLEFDKRMAELEALQLKEMLKVQRVKNLVQVFAVAIGLLLIIALLVRSVLRVKLRDRRILKKIEQSTLE